MGSDISQCINKHNKEVRKFTNLNSTDKFIVLFCQLKLVDFCVNCATAENAGVTSCLVVTMKLREDFHMNLVTDRRVHSSPGAELQMSISGGSNEKLVLMKLNGL